MTLTARKLVRVFLLVVGVLLVVAQFVPLDRSNPRSDPQQHFTVVAKPPAVVANAINRSCRDCHTNDTTWPWYSRVAPASFLVVDDVHEGRAHLNFSEWGKLDARRSALKLEEICDEVKSGAMPDRKYVLLHPDAKLSPEEVQAICGWTEQVLAK
jgi:hypothetical protein